MCLHVNQARIERERKEREKQKKKDKIQRQKEQGTFLTAKQKEDRRRAQQLLESVGQKGLTLLICSLIDWLSMVLRLRQHNIGYTADGFYRSDDPTNSVKALKEGG